MKKKNILITILMLILILPNTIFAFVEDVGQNITPEPPNGLSDMTNNILGVIQWAGYGIAIGMIMYIGIKYMMSAANEKANMKQALINYLIGAAIIFAVTSIFTVCVEFFGGSVPTEEPEKPATGIVKPGTVHKPVIGGAVEMEK